MAEPIEHVDIAAFLSSKTTRENEVKVEEEIVRKKQEAFNVAWGGNVKDLTEKIRQKKATTGDDLMDEIIVSLGLDERLINPLLKLNERFVGAKGIEFLIAHRYEVDMIRSGPGGPRHTSSRDAFILGILSGERMSVSGEGFNQKLGIPFEKYVETGFKSGFGRKDEPLRHDKKLEIGGGFLSEGNLCTHTVVMNIIGEENSTVFFFGEEINPGNVCGKKFFLHPDDLEKMRKLLSAASTEEAVKGADI